MNSGPFTLWDIMNHYCASQMMYVAEQLVLYRQKLESLKSQIGGGVVVPSPEIDAFVPLVKTASKLCFSVGFTKAWERINRIHLSWHGVAAQQDISTVLSVIGVIQDSLREEMQDRHFLAVAPDRVAFLESAPDIFPFHETNHPFTFWGNGKDYFIPRASSEIRDAGNCLAAECPTAAVFHAMRVAEWGLRILARRLKVRITHKKSQNLSSLQLGTKLSEA